MRKKIQQEGYSCSLASGVALYRSTSAFLPLTPHFSPILFPGNKVKEFCCGQVWNLSGSSPVVSITEKAVIKGDRALRSLGGEVAAGEGNDRSLELPTPLEQVSALAEKATPGSFSAPGGTERGRCACKRASSLSCGVHVLC